MLGRELGDCCDEKYLKLIKMSKSPDLHMENDRIFKRALCNKDMKDIIAFKWTFWIPQTLKKKRALL